MPILASDKGGDFDIPEPGNYRAACVRVLDMGIQSTNFGDKRRVRIEWELDEADSKGNPFLISQMYTLSLSSKAILRKDLQSWRGRAFTDEELKAFDLEKLVGQSCMIQVVHNTSGERTYANVASISSLPKGMEKHKPKTSLMIFSCDDPDVKLLEDLPEYWSDKILTGLAAYKDSLRKPGQAPEGMPAGTAADMLEDEIPFDLGRAA